MHTITRFSGASRRALLLATAAALLLAPPAFAQAERAGGVEEITVTAQRRTTNLQDTPIAVTALTAAALERQQILSTTDLDAVTPNLQFTSYGTLTGNNSAAQVFVRGIGQTDATPAVDPGVGIYIDEVYLGRSVGGAMDFRDIANVQVLRGPQGTLFGRNTIGGAVLMTTNEPGAEFGGTMRLGVGEDNLRELFAAINVPLNEQLRSRISFGARKRDGYVTRLFDGVDLGDENTYTAQGALAWDPTSSLSFTLRADYSSENENGSPFVFRAMEESATFVRAASAFAGCPGYAFGPPVPQTNDPRCGNDFQAKGPFTNGGTAPAFSKLENEGVSLVAKWAVSDVLTLKSISSARRLDWSGARDADNTPLLMLHSTYASESKQVSQELQAAVETERLKGVVGVYYFDEDTDDIVGVALAAPPGIVQGSRDQQFVHLDTRAVAAFTDWTFSVTDALSVTAGVRYTEETKGIQGTMFNVNPLTAPNPNPLPTALCPFGGAPPTQTGCLFVTKNRYERDFASTTGSASIQYRWNENLMTYAGWSQGFKSGGFNQRYNNAPPGNNPIGFDPETAETYEVGVKSDITDSLRVNAAVFTTAYDEIQLTYRLGVVPLLFNAGKATVNGGEVEFTYAPTADFILEGSLGYLDNSYDRINATPFPGTTQTAFLSNKLPFTPEWQAHLGAAYTFHLSDALELTPRVDATYTASQFFDASNSPEIAQNDDVTTVNASLALANPNASWKLTLGVNNLTDELYPLAGTSSLATAAGYAEIINARPRNVFASVSVNF